MTDHPRGTLPNAHEFVDLSDGVTHYRCDGPDDAPTVLMLHGATVPAWEFDRLVPYLLDEGMRCVRLDLFGHGYSDRPHVPHDYKMFVRQVEEFIDAIGLQGPVSLLGHSLGSVIAARLLLQSPDWFSSLVMTAPMWRFMKPGWPSLMMSLPGVGELLVHGYAVPMLRRRRARRYKDIEDGRFVRFFEEQLALPGFGRSLLSLVRCDALGNQSSVYQALQQAQTPLLFVRGDEDTIVTDGAFRDILRTVPRAEVVRLEDTAHAMLLTHPEKVASAVVPYLKRSLS